MTRSSQPEAPEPARMVYQPALDGIRALLVLAVIAYHYGYPWAPGGFLGVDAFFVLSGFLITTLLLAEWRDRGTIRKGRFWARRVRRLLPASLLVFLFVAVYTATAVDPVARGDVRSDGLAGLFYVANWRFMFSGQSYFDLFAAPSPLRHMWSLAIEEQFYFVWPLIAVACLSLGRGSRRLLTLVCCGGIVGSVVLMAVVYDEGNPSRAYYGTDTRAHTLLIGCLLALLIFERKLGGRALRVAGLLAATAVLFAWHWLPATDSIFYFGGSAVYAVAVAVVISSVLFGGWLQRVLSIRPLVWIGSISYGLYLWHWPLIVWLDDSRVGLSRSSLNLVRLAATFAAATASFYWVERPIRNGWRPRRVGWWAAPVAIATTAVLIVVSGLGAEARPGYLGPAFGFVQACPYPGTNQAQLAHRAKHHLEGTPTSTRQRSRILLIGDSTACSLYPGLSTVAAASGVRVDHASVLGCGVVSDEVASLKGGTLPTGTKSCHGIVTKTIDDSLARSRPDVVLWMSIWEKSDLRVGGRTLGFGSPKAKALIMRRMDREFFRLTRRGAHLVMVTQAPRVPGSALGVHLPTSPGAAAEWTRLNALIVEFANRHPGEISILDLAKKLCPSGPPCPEEIEGFRPRPDGGHFSSRGATWAARWLLPQVIR